MASPISGRCYAEAGVLRRSTQQNLAAFQRAPITVARMPRRPRRARSAPAPTEPFRLSVTAATGATLVPYLRRHIAAAHAILKPPLGELSIALVGDRRMAELHERFLGVSGPTDVLTFPLEADRRGRPVSGEVVVCVPEARRRGAAEETGLKREVLLYALHGLLHLCGFDDRTRKGFAAMHRTEDAILTSLGIGPVFSATGEARAKANATTKAAALTLHGASGGKRSAAVSHRASAKGKPGAKASKAERSDSSHARSLPAGGARRASGRSD